MTVWPASTATPYRAAAIAGALTNSVFGMVRAAVLTGAIATAATSSRAAATTAPTVVAGYTAAQGGGTGGRHYQGGGGRS